jgi:YHS domain-containing protein
MEEDTTALKIMIRDPVCGMHVEIGRAFRFVEYGPKTYHFCSKDCLKSFNERPEDFAAIERMESRFIA